MPEQEIPNGAACSPLKLINVNRFAGNTPYAVYLEYLQQIDERFVAFNGEIIPTFQVDATNNWWGSNSNPKLNPVNIGGKVDQVDADPWLILTIGADPTAVPFGATSVITAKVTMNSDGQDTSSLGHIPDGTPLTITTAIGNVGSKSVVRYTVKGIVNTILRADDGWGTANLFAILDGFRTPVPVNVVIAQAATVRAGTIAMQNTGVPLAGLAFAL